MPEDQEQPQKDLTELERLRTRAARERAARLEAESIAERATLALWTHNEELEDRVRQRTGEMEAARAETEAANAVKDTILASLAHEVRSPLTVIVAACEELAAPDPADAEVRLELAEASLAAAAALDRALGQLLRLVTDTSGQASGVVTEHLAVDLDARLADWAHRAAVSGVLLTADVDPLLDAPARIDRAAVLDVLDEVLENAVRFGGPGAVDVTAGVFGSPGPAELVVTVTDHGPGIPVADLERVFEPFVQLDAGSTRRHGGLGMGLALAAHLVEAAGGSIRAESAGPGTGVTIRFTVPLEPARRSSDRGLGIDGEGPHSSQEERRRRP